MTEHEAEIRQPKRQPIVIHQEEHPVREEDIDQDALSILYRLKEAGFSGYLVGGGVRDLYLGKKPKDFDISTDAHPGQLRKVFRNSRTIGRRFRLVQVFFKGNKIIEVSTLRSQSEYDEDGGGGGQGEVLPSNNTFGTLEEDAFRRDLTINSLFYEIETKTVIDYVGGVQDLADKVVRLVGDPDRRLTRDPVRMLRAVRHAARAGFNIEAATWEAIVRHRDKLELCPISRIRDELLKDLQSGRSRAWAELAIEIGLFSSLFPFYGELLSGLERVQVRQELLALLAVADRIHAAGGKMTIDEALLFALLLYPWAERHFGLRQADIKGAGHHRMVVAVRDGLDAAFFSRLNLPRILLDSITTLLVNSQTFLEGARSGIWPAWLRKKSYFNVCSRFAAYCLEAMGGAPIDAAQFAAPLPAEASRPPREREGSKKREDDAAATFSSSGSGNRVGGGGGCHPAFSSREGGIFGLRKTQLLNLSH